MRLPLVFLLLLVSLLAAPTQASVEKDALAARAALQKGRIAEFNRLDARIPTDHPLKPYLRYWRLKSGATSLETLSAFAEAHPDSVLSERAWQEVARFHGRDENWPAYVPVSARLAKRDREIQCFDLRARLARNDASALTEGLALWRTGQDLPSSCEPLFAVLEQVGRLDTPARLERLRLALEAGNLRLARELLARMPESTPADTELLAQAQRSPEAVLSTPSDTESAREIRLHALSRLAKEDPERAATHWEIVRHAFTESQQAYGWGEIGMAGARKLHPKTVDWFLRTGAQQSDSQKLWRLRAMLRAGRWLDVYQGIGTLSPAQQNEAVWRYWKARALKALNAQFPANQLFAQLSREIHYYGLLAYEELPVRMEARPQEYRPTPDQVAAIEARPGLARALLLRRMGLIGDAVAEWEWALRGLDDAGLIAAADVARRAEWHDRAMLTAEKTRELHSYDLRYLTPYRDLAEAQAREHGLDPAWVYGLMRQESRFVNHARSPVGAQGLMQIMPATARWISQRLGLGRKAHTKMNDPDANIRFGTYYLRHLLDSLDGSPVLATAGYNAGPGRARRWQAEVPLEGTLYVETIPFTETREYVKKVLANAMYYSQRLGTPSAGLKERLGIIPARVPAQTPGPADFGV